MNHKLHIATGDFCFVETEVTGTADEALQEAQRLERVVKGGAGIPVADFNALLDEYLTTGGIKNGGDVWENMSKEQQAVFQEIKKSRKRTNK